MSYELSAMSQIAMSNELFEIAEKVQFRHCERSEAISILFFDKKISSYIIYSIKSKHSKYYQKRYLSYE